MAAFRGACSKGFAIDGLGRWVLGATNQTTFQLSYHSSAVFLPFLLLNESPFLPTKPFNLFPEDFPKEPLGLQQIFPSMLSIWFFLFQTHLQQLKLPTSAWPVAASNDGDSTEKSSKGIFNRGIFCQALAVKRRGSKHKKVKLNFLVPY